MDINRKITVFFEGSYLFNKKIPDKKVRDAFLKKLLEAPAYKKEAFLKLFMSGDIEMREAAQSMLDKFSGARQKVKEIQSEAKIIFEEGEKADRESTSLEILNQL